MAPDVLAQHLIGTDSRPPAGLGRGRRVLLLAGDSMTRTVMSTLVSILEAKGGNLGYKCAASRWDGFESLIPPGAYDLSATKLHCEDETQPHRQQLLVYYGTLLRSGWF